MIDISINNLNVWTSARIRKASVGRGGHGKLTAYGIKKLRELILELAVTGKLVAQDPNDETAEVLLKKVIKEKERLVQLGKIKKRKTGMDISKADGLFELPEGWVWARLGSIGNIFNGNSINESVKEANYTNVTGGWPFIATKDVGYGWDELDYNNGVSIPLDDEKFRVAHKGAVLICAEGGSAGKKCGIARKDICFGNKLFAIELFGNISSDYLLAYYLSPEFFKKFSGGMTGIIGGISTAKFEQILLPLPPAAEQQRIVAKLAEMMNHCNQLEKEQADSLTAHKTLVENLLGALINVENADGFTTTWQRIANHFDTLFTTEDSIDQLEQTILQLAVMGKLVPQDINDEPASLLEKKINDEKARLIKAGKIKESNKLPKVNEQEKPFCLPDKWVWTRLGSVTLINPRNEAANDALASFVPMHLISTTHVGQHGQEDRQWGSIKKGYTHFCDGDIGLAKITPCFENSKAAIFSNLTNGIGAGTTELHIARPYGATLCGRYILLYLKSPLFLALGETKMTGTAGQKRVPRDFFEGNPLPLPPLVEQYRIVAKVDELMTVCDSLKKCIEAIQKTQVHLADAIVDQTLVSH